MEFIDLKAQYTALKEEIDAGITKVLSHTQFISGEEVAKLERELEKYLDVKYAITCGNGTDALQMVYMAYGIGSGDAVFCPDVTFIASIEPAVMLGAIPVFCDINLEDFNISPESLERQIQAVLAQNKLIPKAVVAVDFLGNPANYEVLSEICKRYKLLLIEDAAQSFGASVNGKKCGSFGDIATTSFFPSKPLGCYGDGGAVMTDNDEIAKVIRSLCVHGKGTSKYDNIRIGLNSRLDTMQAAILLPKLHALEKYEIEARQEVAKRYNDAFKGKLEIQKVNSVDVCTYAQYAVLTKDAAEQKRVEAHLKSKNIPTMVYYPTPQHMLPIFANVNNYGEKFKGAMAYCSRTISLPMHPYLEKNEQDRVIEAVLEVVCE